MDALNIARSISNAGLRDLALNPVAQAQAKAGDISQALSTARGITKVISRAEALSAVAEAQAEAGDSHGAARTISDALNTARGTTNPTSRASALRTVAGAQAKAGDISQALSTARGITDPFFRVSALSLVARAQAMARTQQDPQQPQKAGIACGEWNTERFFRRRRRPGCRPLPQETRCQRTGREREDTVHAAAVVSNRAAVLAALAKAGAKLDARDEKAARPCTWPRYWPPPRWWTRWLQAGAPLDAADEQGRTPLQLAEKFSKTPGVVDALRKATDAANAARASASAASCDGWNTADTSSRRIRPALPAASRPET